MRAVAGGQPVLDLEVEASSVVHVIVAEQPVVPARARP